MALKKRIAYLTGSRADFGQMTLILKEICLHPDFELLLFATGMHLMKEFGSTIQDVKSKFDIVEEFPATFTSDDRFSMAKFISDCVSYSVNAIGRYRTDAVIILGDRPEALAFAIAASYNAIPIIHLHGGENTTTVDDKARKAITMLADWHLTASDDSRQQLISMGISPGRIETVGAPGLDHIRLIPKNNKKEHIVVLQHPDEQENHSYTQIETTLRAVISFNFPVIVIFPNADAGGRAIIEMIEKSSGLHQNINVTKSLTREAFLELLLKAKVLVGNSSCGIIEAPSLGLPVVNIGPRQEGRLRAPNIIDVDYDFVQIKKAIHKSLYDKEFIDSLNGLDNPYGDGYTTPRVIMFLERIVL